MTDNKPLLAHKKQRLELANDEISTPIFSTDKFLIVPLAYAGGTIFLTQFLGSRFHLKV